MGEWQAAHEPAVHTHSLGSQPYPALGTYTAQIFTVNSESMTVRLSGAVNVTSNFGNTTTNNNKPTLALLSTCRLR